MKNESCATLEREKVGKANSGLCVHLESKISEDLKHLDAIVAIAIYSAIRMIQQLI